MWKYVKNYLHLAVIAALFMVGEVTMDLLQPRIMSRIVDEGVLGIGRGGTGSMSLIWSLGFRMILLVLIGGTCGVLNNIFVHISSQSMGNEMRKDCFRKIMTFSFPQNDRIGTGSLVTRVTNDITQIQSFLSLFVRGMIRNFMLMFGSIYFIFRLNYHFGMLVLMAFPYLVGCVAVCLAKANPLFPKLQAQLDRINAILQEDISGIRIIKACVREIYEKIRFGKANEKLIATQLKTLVIFAFMNPAVNALMYFVVALLLLSGFHEVNAGLATPGAVMAAVTYTTQLLHGVLMLVMLSQNISRGIASWKRVREILYSSPELEDGSFEGQTREKGKIEFREVSFSYPGSGRKILEHVSFTVYPGETVAIMGATGCGKTTLVSLIPRFYDVAEGAVLVDGVDVRTYQQKALRSKIAICLQKSELFGDSLSGNISWGNPQASEQEIYAAAETAQAEEFIRSMPEGYQTVVAERGVSLSGGQRQRISIARAIVGDPEILIFDDSTSALDLKTEANLYHALETAKPEVTKVIVAQRIASVRRADRILVLDRGGIAACGTHEELLETCSAYRDIYDSQMGEEQTHNG